MPSADRRSHDGTPSAEAVVAVEQQDLRHLCCSTIGIRSAEEHRCRTCMVLLTKKNWIRFIRFIGMHRPLSQ